MANDEPFYIKLGDTLPIFTEQLFNGDGTVIDLTTAVDIQLQIHWISGVDFIKDLSNGVEIVGDPSDGRIRCLWNAGDISVPGRHLQEVRAEFGSGDVVHVPNDREGYPFIVAREAVSG